MTQRPRWQPLVLRTATACALLAAAPALPPAVGGAAGPLPGVAGWSALAAQTTPPRQPRADRRGWTAVRVAKWALAGATVGLGYYALRQSTRADRAYGDLRRLCVTTPSACTLDGSRYPDAHAEGLYAVSLRHDRRAQAGILVGQVTLLGSAALFVYDLRNGRGPENIPFPGVPAQLTQSAPAGARPTRAFAPTAPPALRLGTGGAR